MTIWGFLTKNYTVKDKTVGHIILGFKIYQLKSTHTVHLIYRQFKLP